MSSHLSDMLEEWLAARDRTDWALGVVWKTEGSAYRKAGAMMLVGRDGRRLGLLSGGCLEADIARNAARAMDENRPATLTYDGADEDDVSFRLGIGCGGTVHIVLHPISAANDLGLSAAAAALRAGKSGLFAIPLPGPDRAAASPWFEPGKAAATDAARIETRQGAAVLTVPVRPKPHILIVGGGIDAVPVLGIAEQLGWRVSIADPRPANARPEHFPGADAVLRDLGPALAAHVAEAGIECAVVMSHSVDLDSQALRSLSKVRLRHAALLGPRHRYIQVLDRAGLNPAALPWPLSGPAGLPLGGSLPESIALSIIAECHAMLHDCAQHAAPAMAAE